MDEVKDQHSSSSSSKIQRTLDEVKDQHSRSSSKIQRTVERNAAIRKESG